LPLAPLLVHDIPFADPGMGEQEMGGTGVRPCRDLIKKSQQLSHSS
jgi:hypothetical protein